MIKGKQREEGGGRFEEAGAVELKDWATGADEVRWLAGGRCDFDSAAVHKHKEPRPGLVVDGQMGRWKDRVGEVLRDAIWERGTHLLDRRTRLAGVQGRGGIA